MTVYNQSAVRDAILTTGHRSGNLDLRCAVTEGEEAVYIAIGNHQAFFTPHEIRVLLNDLIDVSDVEAWLHEPSTLHAIARLRDYADVVDNHHEKSLQTINERWDGFNEQTYDFEDDPLDLKESIQAIKEAHG